MERDTHKTVQINLEKCDLGREAGKNVSNLVDLRCYGKIK